MAVYPGANYRPLNNFSDRGVMPRLGVVLHVNDSQGNGLTSPGGDSLYNWIAGDNNMSCHWQVSQTGGVEQYVDTDNAAWCQSDGNRDYLSIETEGLGGTPLTDAQVKACAGIMRWCHATHGIPLVIADSVGERGLAWHGMGGNSWGGHFDCPGEPRKAQRKTILALAGGADPAMEDDMTPEQAAMLKDNNRLLHLIISGRIEDPKTPGTQAIDGLMQLAARNTEIRRTLAGLDTRLATFEKSLKGTP